MPESPDAHRDTRRSAGIEGPGGVVDDARICTHELASRVNICRIVHEIAKEVGIDVSQHFFAIKTHRYKFFISFEKAIFKDRNRLFFTYQSFVTFEFCFERREIEVDDPSVGSSRNALQYRRSIGDKDRQRIFQASIGTQVQNELSVARLALSFDDLQADVPDHWRITLEGRIKCFGLGASLFTTHRRLDQRRDEVGWNCLVTGFWDRRLSAVPSFEAPGTDCEQASPGTTAMAAERMRTGPSIEAN